MTNEVITIPTGKAKREGKTLLVKGMSAKAKRNIRAQQSEYMKRTGKTIRLDYLAGKLLETATL
jgi:hypothetical protein